MNVRASTLQTRQYCSFSVVWKQNFNVVLLMLLGVTFSHAQDPAPPLQPQPHMSFGIIGGYAMLSNKTNLAVYESSPYCGSFSNGEAQAPFFGLTYEYPLLDFVDVSARLLYAQRPATLRMQTDNGMRAFDPTQGKDVPYIRENVFTADLNYMCVDVGIRLKPFEMIDVPIPLFIRAAVDAGDPIFGNSYTQTEQIIQPTSRTFPDGTLKHTLFSGTLAHAGTTYGVNGSVGYSLRLDRHMFLNVEAGYRKGLNSVVNNQDWKVNSYFGALNLSYAIVDEEEKPAEVPAPPPVQTEPIPIVVTAPTPLVIEAFNTTPLEVRETIVTETYPLLPYVFFDSSATALRERYKQSVDPKSFREQDLVKNTLSIYYHVLDIVASRLRAHPQATISVIGTTDGRELSSASQRKSLAEERARTVQAYLVNTWGIAEERVQVGTQDIPQLASNPQYSEGLEENRRVEIASSDASILSPVVHARFMEYAPVQSKQVFHVKALRPEKAQSWDASIQKNKNVARVSGSNGLPGMIPFEVDSSVMVSIGHDITAHDSLDGSLRVLQTDGSSIQAACRFPIIKSQNQFELSRLSLIVFDFDRSDISTTNKDMMRTFIRDAMQPGSHINITGSTDRLGEAQYNKNLSQNRAQEVKDFLLQLQENANIESCIGIGASRLPYDNALPEGRYYCRTVSIVVQTPIHK